MKQKEALDILKMGHNIFLTGPAGSGKTFLLNQYISYLKENNINQAVTASTGIAATHINGRTIHSWCGMGINQSMNDEEIKKLLKKKYIAERINKTKVLVIDEISMINAKQLDLVNKICQVFARSLQPFGGLQTILCGDFFQLPPIKGHGEKASSFVFEADIWNNMNLKICYLEEQHRQTDKQLLKILSDIRANQATEKTKSILKTRQDKSIKTKIRPTKLYTHNHNVDAENFLELDKIAEKEVCYEMTSDGIPDLVKSLKSSYCSTSEKLKVKIGAVVMFAKNNFEKGFINGTLGKVIGYDKEEGYPIVKILSGKEIIASPEKWSIEENGETLASVSQVPLKLAWAITVHKSQGMSLDCAEIDLTKTFEFGMGYVALSRVKKLTGIKLTGLNDMALKVNEAIVKLNEDFLEMSQQSLKELKKLSAQKKKNIQKKFINDNQITDDILDNFRAKNDNIVYDVLSEF